MLNNVILVGRVVEEPKLVKTEKGHYVTNLVIAVQRPFKNENNEYDTDFIPITTWMGLAELICEYVGKGSILGFKCRLGTHLVDISEQKFKTIDVIAERVSFIKLHPRTQDKLNKKDEIVVVDENVKINEFDDIRKEELDEDIDDLLDDDIDDSDK